MSAAFRIKTICLHVSCGLSDGHQLYMWHFVCVCASACVCECICSSSAMFFFSQYNYVFFVVVRDFAVAKLACPWLYPEYLCGSCLTNNDSFCHVLLIGFGMYLVWLCGSMCNVFGFSILSSLFRSHEIRSYLRSPCSADVRSCCIDWNCNQQKHTLSNSCTSIYVVRLCWCWCVCACCIVNFVISLYNLSLTK